MIQELTPPCESAAQSADLHREAFLADLTWECVEKLRAGEQVNIASYLQKCPDDAARSEFQIVIGMSLLADALFRSG